MCDVLERRSMPGDVNHSDAGYCNAQSKAARAGKSAPALAVLQKNPSRSCCLCYGAMWKTKMLENTRPAMCYVLRTLKQLPTVSLVFVFPELAQMLGSHAQLGLAVCLEKQKARQAVSLAGFFELSWSSRQRQEGTSAPFDMLNFNNLKLLKFICPRRLVTPFMNHVAMACMKKHPQNEAGHIAILHSSPIAFAGFSKTITMAHTTPDQKLGSVRCSKACGHSRVQAKVSLPSSTSKSPPNVAQSTTCIFIQAQLAMLEPRVSLLAFRVSRCKCCHGLQATARLLWS